MNYSAVSVFKSTCYVNRLVCRIQLCFQYLYSHIRAFILKFLTPCIMRFNQNVGKENYVNLLNTIYFPILNILQLKEEKFPSARFSLIFLRNYILIYV